MTRQKMIVNSNDGDPNISNWCNIACHLNTLAHLFIMLSLKVNIYIYISFPCLQIFERWSDFHFGNLYLFPCVVQLGLNV